MTTPQTIRRDISDEELSALVASIHGWKNVRKLGPKPWDGLIGKSPLSCYEGEGFEGVPPYATSLDAVLPLAEKWLVDLSLNPQDLSPDRWRCSLYGNFHQHDGFALTATRAVCFALLAAKGVTVEDAT
jgi:hypothetical protein